MAVITAPFATSARILAAAHGLPDYPFVVIPHPIAGNSDEELRVKAELTVDALIPLLIARPADADLDAPPRLRA